MTSHPRPAAHLQNVLSNPHTTATTVLAAAHDVPHINLADALEITLRIRGHPLYPRAAARWIARLVLERRATILADVEEAIDAFAELGLDANATERLRGLARGAGPSHRR